MAKFAALGTILGRGDGATPEEFNVITQISNLSGPTIASGIEGNPTHDDDWHENVGTVPDAWELTFEIESDPTEVRHTVLLTALADRDEYNYKLIFPDDTTILFVGIVSAFSPAAPVAGKLTASVTITVTGEPDFNHLSDSTALRTTDAAIVTALSNALETMTVVAGTTVAELIAVIESLDLSVQVYAVEDVLGNPKIATDAMADDDEFLVEAADGIANASYTVTVP